MSTASLPKRRKAKTAKSEPGSGNVFADLGFKNSEEMLAKAELVRQINNCIKERGLNQTEAAALLGVHQPEVSALKRGRLTDFSIDRLLHFLVLFGREVDICVRTSPRGGLKVMTAS